MESRTLTHVNNPCWLEFTLSYCRLIYCWLAVRFSSSSRVARICVQHLTSTGDTRSILGWARVADATTS